MTDLQTPVVPEEKATPETPEPIKPAGQEQEQPQAETPKYVTEEQLGQAVAEAVRNVKMADRQRAKQIKQEIASLEKRLEAAGLQVTPEQKQKLENEVIASYSDDDEEPAPQGDIDIPPEVAPAINWMLGQGVKIDESDPEYKQYLEPVFDVEKLDQFAINLAMSKAVEAKRARTLQSKEKSPLRTPAGGGSEGPGEFKANDAKGYWTRAHSK